MKKKSVGLSLFVCAFMTCMYFVSAVFADCIIDEPIRPKQLIIGSIIFFTMMIVLEFISESLKSD